MSKLNELIEKFQHFRDELVKGNNLDNTVKTKLKAEMDKRKFGEADAIKHVIDRDKGDTNATKPKSEPLKQSEKDRTARAQSNAALTRMGGITSHNAPTMDPAGLKAYEAAKEKIRQEQKGSKKPKLSVVKADLVKALNDAGHRESALLLKNWDEMDSIAEELYKGLKAKKLKGALEYETGAAGKAREEVEDPIKARMPVGNERTHDISVQPKTKGGGNVGQHHPTYSHDSTKAGDAARKEQARKRKR